ncbi:MAG: hypothetical protein KAX80_05510 [Planctomycetes bacterium]|nr:hypothetical protein [Planctomycetota bacterium]
MDTVEELRQLGIVMREWTKRIQGLVKELEQMGVRVDVSVGIRASSPTRGARGEIIIDISPLEAYAHLREF